MEYISEGNLKTKSDINLKNFEIGRKRWTRRLLKTIKKHKIISLSFIAFTIFSMLNIIMIYSFMNILGGL